MTMSPYPAPTDETPRTVKDLDPDDQPREKAEKYGCKALSVADLWALVLRTGTPGYPITQLCRDLMRDNNGSLRRLERRDREYLRTFKGIGAMKSIQIEAVMELLKRFAAENPSHEQPIKEASQIYERMRFKTGNLDHEEIWALLVNRRNQVIREMRVTTGTQTASLFDVKPIVKSAILENADGVILTHNHPSGNLVPSEPDKRITRELKEACKYMSLRMLDHVIVTTDGFYSFAAEGKL